MKDYYNIKRISNSSINWFQVSPKFFKLMFDKEIEEEDKFKYEKGEIVHTYILEPEEFKQNYVFLDYETPKSTQQKEFCETFARAKKGTEDEKLIKAYKNAYTTKESDDKILEKAVVLKNQLKSYINSIKLSTVKTVLQPSMKEKLEEINSCILNHKIASDLVYNNMYWNADIHNEYPIYWTHSSGLDCKSLIDRLIIDHERKIIKIVDLKTTSSYKDFIDKVDEYSYYRQLAFYTMAIKNSMQVEDYTFECYIVAINMKEPTEVKVFKLKDDPTLLKGIQEINYWLPRIKWHFDNELWDYTQEYYEGTGIEEI